MAKNDDKSSHNNAQTKLSYRNFVGSQPMLQWHLTMFKKKVLMVSIEES